MLIGVISSLTTDGSVARETKLDYTVSIQQQRINTHNLGAHVRVDWYYSDTCELIVPLSEMEQ